MNSNSILGIVGLTAGAFALFVPWWHDIKEGRAKPKDVRDAEAISIVWSLVFTSVVAQRSGNSETYGWWLLTAGTLVAFYEYALHIGRADKSDCGCGCGGSGGCGGATAF